MKTWMLFIRRSAAVVLAAVLPGVMLLSCNQSGKNYPATDKKPVTESYGDITVVDNYRWLDNLQDPPVRQWNDAQNVSSRKYFDGISCLHAVQERLKDVMAGTGPTYCADPAL